MSWVESAGKMFPGSVGGQSRVVTPRSKPLPQAKRRERGKVWGNNSTVDLAWIGASGTPTGTADPYTADIDLSDFHPGGNDGTNHYLLIDHGEINASSLIITYIGKFNAGVTSLLDLWSIPDWDDDPFSGVADSLTPDIQNVCAGGGRVVLSVDLIDNDTDDPVYADLVDDPGANISKHYIGVAVWDYSGTLLAQHLVYTSVGYLTGGTPAFEFVYGGLQDSAGDLDGRTGSCTDGEFVYFWHWYTDLATGDYQIVSKVDLETGAITRLFADYDIGANPTVSRGRGIVVLPGGDLITASLESDDVTNPFIARVQQDGTVVWTQDTGQAYQAVAHSGRNSVWAAYVDTSSPQPADEFAVASGAVGASAEFPEGVSHAWLQR